MRKLCAEEEEEKGEKEAAEKSVKMEGWQCARGTRAEARKTAKAHGFGLVNEDLSH